MGILERIAEVEAEMARTQRNKKTEHHIGCLKARIAKLRRDLYAPSSKVSGPSFEIPKSGDCRAVLIGLPSVGKSTLLSAITPTMSKSAEHAFTTVDCIAGRFTHQGVDVQLLDLPGIIHNASKGIGRGKQVVSVCRTADVVVFCLDPLRNDFPMLYEELRAVGVCAGKTLPPVVIEKTVSGGIIVTSTVSIQKTGSKTENSEIENSAHSTESPEMLTNSGNQNKSEETLSEDAIKGALRELGLTNCRILIKGKCTLEDIVDAACGHTKYPKLIKAYNKVDTISIERLNELSKDESAVFISSKKKWGLENLKLQIVQAANLTRIYTKTKSQKMPSFDEPLILRDLPTVRNACERLHKDFVSSFKYAFVWGASAKHQPQRVGLSHILKDEDVIQIFT